MSGNPTVNDTETKPDPELAKLFAFSDSISDNKKNLLEDGTLLASDYRKWAFSVNRLLSKHIDCIFYVSEMNSLTNLDPVMQYEYLLHAIRARRRRGDKRIEPKKDLEFIAVRDFFCYSRAKTETALRTLTKDQIKVIVKRHEQIKKAI
jgi:hypothetical protein